MPTLTAPQWKFISDTNTPNIAFSGGMGAGKSLAGALKVLDLACRNLGHPGIVWAPYTRDAKEGIIKVVVQVLKGEHESGFHFPIPHAFDKSTGYVILHPHGKTGKETPILVRSSEQDIVGTNAAWAVADELDTLNPIKARHVFQQLTQRIRAGNTRQLAVTTTPEGYRFLWEHFVQELRANPDLAHHRRLITASLFTNPFVSDEYIHNIILAHTPEQQRARIHGEFVNLHASRVYQYFSREDHSTDATVAAYPNADLWIGMDFNINMMAAVVGINLPNQLLVVDELIGTKEQPILDVRSMIELIKARYPNKRIHICPDASGANRDASNGWTTKLHELALAGFTLHNDRANPSVDLRISNVNRMFYNATTGANSTLRVNHKMCPLLLRTLEQQPYNDKDQPDTKGGLEHGGDALGYLVMQTFGQRLAQAASSPWRH